MSIYVLDASAILRFTDKEAGFNRVRDLLKRAAKGEIELLISAVNWAEIVMLLHKRAGSASGAGNLAANLSALPISIIAVDQSAAEAAAAFKVSFKVPLADAFAGSLALSQSTGTPQTQATLVTADYDFKAVPSGTMKIEFLPAK